MTRVHVTAVAGPKDTFRAILPKGDSELLVPYGLPGHEEHVESSVAKVFAKHHLTLSPFGDDLLRLAIAAYTADTRTPRETGFGSWTRQFCLNIFVHDPERWGAAREDFQRLLSFLTGDIWEINVRPVPAGYEIERAPTPRKTVAVAGDTVCLFSGGLDSFVGALDCAASGPVVLVGHHSADGGATSRSQKQAIAALRRRHVEAAAPFLRIWISPPKGPTRGAESTTRGRSILFLALGLAVADASGARRLVVPENGVISLNVPLSPSRLGSFSTRTTHPHLIDLLRRALGELACPIEIEMPYRFKTKGEMLRECLTQDLLPAGVEATMSCARPSLGRFAKTPNTHCGRCVPCIIRRAAVEAVMKDPTPYKVTDVRASLSAESGSDLKVMRMALDRYAAKPARLAELLRAGPLPGSDDEKRAYLEMFKRGIDEIRRLFV
jgi:hypothetical protein